MVSGHVTIKKLNLNVNRNAGWPEHSFIFASICYEIPISNNNGLSDLTSSVRTLTCQHCFVVFNFDVRPRDSSVIGQLRLGVPEFSRRKAIRQIVKRWNGGSVEDTSRRHLGQWKFTSGSRLGVCDEVMSDSQTLRHAVLLAELTFFSADLHN